MAENYPNQIFVYKKLKNLNATSDDINEKFELIKRILIKDKPEFEKICMQFTFKITKYEREPDTLIFVRQHKIIQLNFITE
jgi:hypothetical protein